jgi:plasmid maintenance system antidote protein VapI
MYKLSDRKLSMYQAEKIREANRMGTGKQKLAQQYGVSKKVIQAIIENRTYKTAEPPKPTTNNLF